MSDSERFVRAHENTLILFEWYWVEGLSTIEIAKRTEKTEGNVQTLMANRGIPRRPSGDGVRLHEGQTSLNRLRWKYLSPFQQALAQELEADRHEEYLSAEALPA